MNRSKTLPFRETYFHLGNGGMFLAVTETRHQNAALRALGAPSYRRSFALTAEVRFFGVSLAKVQLPLASFSVVSWLIDALTATLQEMDRRPGGSRSTPSPTRS